MYCQNLKRIPKGLILHPLRKPIIRSSLIQTPVPLHVRTMSLMQRRPGGGFPSLIRTLNDLDTFLSSPVGADPTAYSPRFDMHETKDYYYLDGELPGVEKKDVDIEFSDQNTLNIKGHTEHQTSEEDPEHSWRFSERSTGDFRRSFSFPSPVDQEHVEASLKNGVLSIAVPKMTEASAGKHIDIK